MSNWGSINYIGKTGNRLKKVGNTIHSKKAKQAFEKLRANHGKSGKDI
tara:strand:+ start:6013 stop:6156 length:144 start_codon:yes stop_codon:yes gene_type:complete